MRRRWARVVGALALAAVAAGCGPSASGATRTTSATSASVPEPTSSVPPTTVGPSASSTTVPVPAAPMGPSVRERLAVLAIDDRPAPVGAYRRDDWPHWDDVDGNGCDARQDSLIRWSSTTPTLDRSRRCKVLAGTWTSPYDGRVTASPAEIQIDHVVPLAEVFRSGGWRWDAGLRRRFANDPAELVTASPSSNQSKSDSTPDEWRPTRTESWCAYADRWVTVKAAYGLTATTSERDALGQMLDTCTPDSERWP